jgi:hypothetical protein
MVALWLVMSACPSSDNPPIEPEPDPEPLAAVDLVEGTTLGSDHFQPGNTAEGGQGGEIGGIGCVGDVATHFHAHVSLFVEGERIAIPAAVGIVDPVIVDGFAQSGDCFYWTHTHDATGLVHIEPPTVADYTLGQFFEVWGQPLSETNVAGFEGTVSVFVDGVRHTGAPGDIVFSSRLHISLQVATPLSSPPMYNFQG